MASKISEIELQIRFGDLDALGHVNNAAYLSFFELGRIDFFMKFLKGFHSKTVNFVVVHADIDFRIPIYYEDKPRILTEIEKVGTTSVSFKHTILRQGDDAILSSGKTVIVWVDRGGKKQQIPEHIKDLLS
ncbi:MAG: acyl-CoA thioesterase [Thermoplasmataceae archaeon]